MIGLTLNDNDLIYTAFHGVGVLNESAIRTFSTIATSYFCCKIEAAAEILSVSWKRLMYVLSTSLDFDEQMTWRWMQIRGCISEACGIVLCARAGGMFNAKSVEYFCFSPFPALACYCF